MEKRPRRDSSSDEEIGSALHPRPIPVNRRLCPHCNRSVAIKTYKAHKRLFYDRTTKLWHNSIIDASPTPPDSPPNLSEDDNAFLLPEITHSPPNIEVLDMEIDHEVNDNESDESESNLEVWPNNELSSDDDSDVPPNEEPDIQSREKAAEAQALSHWLIAFIFMLQAKYHLTETVISLILKFAKVFMTILGRFSAICSYIAEHIPSSMYRAIKDQNTVKFKRYVTCKRCHSIYYFRDCIEGSGIHQHSKQCTSNPFGRRRCNSLLLKSVELSTGRKIFYPFLTYCYLGIKTPLQSLLCRPGFLEQCELWRSRKNNGTILNDLYDGKVWKEFQCVDGKPFLSEPYCFGVTINVDWFQPYKHITYSVGVIFMTIMNLPRASRFKEENILLIGIIPGPHEPSLHINSFINPLVEELLQLWSGVEIETVAGKQTVRCALLCAACDLPAGRKLCGFLGHSATYGCSKCKKAFPGAVGHTDYSGYERSTWQCRTNDSHRSDVSILLQCKSKTQLKNTESSLGCRYSALLRLEYFDAPRMLIVDPMHNLFTGTAKHYIYNVWVKKGILTNSSFDIVQDRVNRMLAPPDLGRIPLKIQSGFSSFTADQLKNWTVYYSVIALHDIVVNEDLECWRHFVLSCRLLCSRQLSLDQVQLADALLLQFCSRTERMYGKQVTTPNMHMHCHLCQCIRDYGPMSCFWLFPYERINGILGDLPNNNRSIEVQLMKKFLSDQCTSSAPLPDMFDNELGTIVDRSSHEVGSVGDTLCDFQSIHSLNPSWNVDELIGKQIILPKCYTRGVFSAHEVSDLHTLYSKMYSVPTSEIYVNPLYKKYKSVKFNGKMLGSHKSISHSSSILIAEWSSRLLGGVSSQRPIRVNFFAGHPVAINNKITTHLLISASWFKLHPEKNKYGNPITLWYPDVFESPISDYIPIQLIKCRSVSLLDEIDEIFGSALFVCPCIDF